MFAFAPLAGVLLGEGAYGLVLLAESTPTGYWFIQIVVGAIVVGIGARRLGKKPGAVLALTAVLLGLAFLYLALAAASPSLLAGL